MYTERFDLTEISDTSFQQIDTYVCNFQKTAEVPSLLTYGDEASREKPWITILIPTYGRTAQFREALESAAKQLNPGFAWEIVVVDNTPLDESGGTPALYVTRQLAVPNLRFYHNAQNLGSGYNWNRGVELARGEWICFLHDDDVLCRDALQQIGWLLQNGRKVKKNLGYLNARRADFKDCFGEHLSCDFKRCPQEHLTRFGVLICGHTGAGAPTCGTTILKKAYIEAGGINYDFGPSADAVLCYQIMRDYAVVNTDCVIGGYRWNANATLSAQSLLNFVRADDLLMTYAYRQGRFARLWGRLFGDAISWRNVWRKNNIAQEFQIAVTHADFAAASLYAEPGKVKKAVYLTLYAVYRLGRQTIGWLDLERRRIKSLFGLKNGRLALKDTKRGDSPSTDKQDIPVIRK